MTPDVSKKIGRPLVGVGKTKISLTIDTDVLDRVHQRRQQSNDRRSISQIVTDDLIKQLAREESADAGDPRPAKLKSLPDVYEQKSSRSGLA